MNRNFHLTAQLTEKWWIFIEFVCSMFLIAIPSVWSGIFNEHSLIQGSILASFFLLPSEILRQFIGYKGLNNILEILQNTLIKKDNQKQTENNIINIKNTLENLRDQNLLSNKVEFLENEIIRLESLLEFRRERNQHRGSIVLKQRRLRIIYGALDYISHISHISHRISSYEDIVYIYRTLSDIARHDCSPEVSDQVFELYMIAIQREPSLSGVELDIKNIIAMITDNLRQESGG